MENSKKNKYKTLLNDTILFALGSIGSKIISFFLVPFYTYYLSPDEYGIADLVFTVSQLAIPFFSLVIFDAVIRFAINNSNPQDVLLNGIIVWAIGSIALVLLNPLFEFYKAVKDWKWFIVIYVSVSTLLSVELNYLKAVNKNVVYSLICVFQTLILALLNIWFVAHLQLGISGYILSYIGSSILAVLLALFAGNMIPVIRSASFNRALLKQMVLYSSPLIINNISWWVIQSSDKLMLERMTNDTVLGLYNVAARIPSLISVFVSIFQQAWGISSVKEMDSGNDSQYYTSVFSVYSFGAFLGGIGLCTIIKPFMDLYIRSSLYVEVWRYVPLLIASAVFSAFAAYCGSMYGALKKSVNNMLSTLLAAIINYTLNFFLIPLWGIWGAIIGTLTAYTVLAFVRIIDVKRFVEIKISWVKLVSCSVLLLIQVALVSVLGEHSGIILSVFAIIAFLTIYFEDVRLFLHLVFSGSRKNV